MKLNIADILEIACDSEFDEKIESVTASLGEANEALERFNKAAAKLESATKKLSNIADKIETIEMDTDKLSSLEVVAAQYEKDKAIADANARAIDEQTRQSRVEWECNRRQRGLPIKTPANTGKFWAAIGGALLFAAGSFVGHMVEVKSHE